MGNERHISASGRYSVEERLGEGGMGVVYRARDLERGVDVALKTLLRVEPASLRRFKEEFRALTDVAHPNVVELYDLVGGADGTWFLTMELVDGVPFTSWVSGERRSTAPPAASADDATLDAASHKSLPTSGVLRTGRMRKVDVTKLRDALRQLIEGVGALHAAGKLHRDIKPSNVLVTREGRVVLLDFGLVHQFTDGERPAAEEHILGTPAYMAPEQAGPRIATPSSDLYAVGVMLFECLTGRLPFEGSALEILLAKQRGEAPSAARFFDGLPDELVELAADLLRRRPEARPSLDEARARLSPRSAPGLRASGTSAMARRVALVGRADELSAVDEARREVVAGGARLVLLRGPSGVGKSALAEHVVSRLRQDGWLVLPGRCYERESVPYKAFDAAIDALARHLGRLPPEELAPLLPQALSELCRVFPVFRGVEAFDVAESSRHEAEPFELRRRAFGALAEVLGVMSEQAPLAFHLEDLQWGDEDSALLLTELLTAARPLRLLVLGTHRDGPVGAMLQRVLAPRDGARARQLDVGPLGLDDCARLAEELGGARVAARPELARSIAREAAGNPLFVAELVRHQAERADRGEDTLDRRGPATLEEAILARTGELPPEPRALLAVLSVAARPLDRAVALAAAGLPPHDASALRTLTVSKLVVQRQGPRGVEVETFHDRVREALSSRLPSERLAATHGAIAGALEQRGDLEPEPLVHHWTSAGRPEQAKRYVRLAADRALTALAFRRAADLYKRALELGVDDPHGELRRKHADSLAFAGLGRDAALAYREAAAHEPDRDAVAELHRLATEQLLKSGHDEEGLEALKGVLREVGLAFPESSRAALVSAMWHRARLRVQGLGYDERPPESHDPREVARADASYCAAVGLAMLDTLRSADFSARHLRIALSLGDPMRISRGLALEASMTAAGGGAGAGRARKLVQAAESLAFRLGDPRVVAFSKLAAAYVSVLTGDFGEARARMADVELHLRERCSGVPWEMANAQMWLANALILTGELGEAARRIKPLMREAIDRGDRYAMQHILYPVTVAFILDDDVAGAERVHEAFVTGWTLARYNTGHWGALVSRISMERYERRGVAAHDRISTEWRVLKRHFLLDVELVRVCATYERALSALAAVRDGAPERLRAAAGDGEVLAAMRAPYARALGGKVLGLVALASGERKRAHDLLVDAEARLSACRLAYLASCARYRRAGIVGGEEGARVADEVSAALHREGVRFPAKVLDMSAPV